MSKLVIENNQSIWKGHLKLDLATLHYEYDNGQKVGIKREILKAPDSIVILLYRSDNHNLILTKQWRAPLLFQEINEPLIEACAGNIDKKDLDIENQDRLKAAIRAAKREAEEETGWLVKKTDFLYALFSSPGISTERLYYFTAEVDEKINEGGGVIEEGEDIEVVEMSLQTAWNDVLNGKITDAKTVLLLQHMISKNKSL